MGDRSKIEWTDATWNPVTGCTKVSEGCRYCYAERQSHRTFAKQTWEMKTPGCTRPREFTDVACHGDRLLQPEKWKSPRMIFVCSMSDLFHREVPTHFIEDVYEVMEGANHHVFQVLTKRADRMSGFLANRTPSKHIWHGVSVEDQDQAQQRIVHLLEARSVVRWISAEPLLTSIDLRRLYCRAGHVDALVGERVDNGLGYPTPRLDWVVVGGESGASARPMRVRWAQELRDQCLAHRVPFFFKQWGQWVREDQLRGQVRVVERTTFEDGVYGRVRKKADAGATLDGQRWEDMPE